ncbi:MAG: hypothetical protein JNM63_06300, partial [Spirochaetia bacterium]|nr:hypothetical protein [Spirochaetia bacterium]
MKTWAFRKFFFAAFVFAPGLLFASLIFFPADGRKKRDNPSDQKATNYQGYTVTNRDQVLLIVNTAELAEGSTGTVSISNYGWRPLQYQFSEDPSFSGVAWKTMPTSQLISESHSGSPGIHTCYVKLRLPDKSEPSYALSFSFKTKSIFVNVNLGNDTNAGTTPDTAVSTITTGYSLAVKSNFKSICLATGLYN